MLAICSVLRNQGFFFWGGLKLTLKTGPKWVVRGAPNWPSSIYIYIYAVELKTGPRFGVSSVKNWSKSSVKNWSKFFFAVFPSFIVFFWAFLETQIVQQCVKIVFFAKIGGCQKWGFRKENWIFLFFPFLCWRPRNRKRKKENGKGQKTL